MGCLDSITDIMDMSLSKLWEIVKDRKTWCVAIHGVTKSQIERLNNNNHPNKDTFETKRTESVRVQTIH